MNFIKSLRHETHQFNIEIYAFYLALKDPRVRPLARLLLVFSFCYALSPVDLIPDPVQVFGFLDDLVLVPLGVRFALKLIPEQVLNEAKATTFDLFGRDREAIRSAFPIVIFTWLLLGIGLLMFLYKFS